MVLGESSDSTKAMNLIGKTKLERGRASAHHALARAWRIGNAWLQCSEFGLTLPNVKLRAGMTIGIEGKTLLPYVKNFWAKTRVF